MVALQEKLRAAQTVGLDSSIFIYYFEDHARYKALCNEIFDLLETRAIQAVTSTVTLIEVLVQPIRQGNQALSSRYEQYLQFGPSLALRSLDFALAQLAAQLRARYQLRTPDAIQVATAIEYGSSLFVTNDDRLRKITEIEILVLERWLQDHGPTGINGEPQE
jgi:predicted nucleic acid-binding protein